MKAGDLIRRLGAFRLGRSGAAELVALALFGAFLAAIGSFDTGEMSAPSRYLYWELALVGGGVIAALIEPFVAARLPGRPRLFALAQLAVMTPPITVWVALLPVVLFDGRLSVEHIVLMMPSVLTINIAVVVLAWVTRKALNRRDPVPAVPDGVAPPALRAKLPPRLARARLIAVEAEDHYLRIRTDAGSALVLMRLGDALEALSGTDGFRTHRSWWVARTAVEAARWKGGRGQLILSDGSAAPVSRTYAAALKGTDWAAPVA